MHVSYMVSDIGVTIVERPRSLHANVLGRLVPNGLPTGKKAETRLSVDLTNEVQHVGILEVSLERAEEKSTVDRPGLVCSSHIRIRAKTSSVHN